MSPNVAVHYHQFYNLPLLRYSETTRASNRLKYRCGLGSGSAKIFFWRFTSGSGFSSFDFAGLVPVKIKNTLNYWIQVRGSKNLKVQIRFGFKNLKPSI